LNSPAALYQYSEILFRAGNTDEAIEQLSNIEKSYPKSEYAYRSAYLAGWIYFKNESYSNAIESYNEILLRYPESPIVPQVYYSLGDAYYNSEKYEESIANYKKVITDYPTSPYFLDAVSGIQYCYEALGSPDKATTVIDEYLAGNTGSKQSDQLLYKKAEILFNARLYSQAKDNFVKFLGAYPSSKLLPDAYYMLSKCYHNLEIKEDEIASLKLLINKYAESEIAFNAVMDLTTLYNKNKMYDSSVAAFDVMLTNKKDLPRASELLYNKGLTLAHKGDVNAALDVFVETMQNYQGTIFSDKAMFEIALIELAAEQYEFAEKYFKNLGETRTDELGAVSQYNYGFTMFKQKKYQEASEAFEKVLSKFSNFNEWNTKASLKLAETYVLLKEKAKAKELYRSVLKKHPKDIYGKEAKQKLENLR
ncbi:MAG: tetratricopeptide repeat protein, partial [Bacteroidota bacterium]|nr:tetratricopeptide repeat protein [Bacteroidota bacterium]